MTPALVPELMPDVSGWRVLEDWSAAAVGLGELLSVVEETTASPDGVDCGVALTFAELVVLSTVFDPQEPNSL